MFVIIKDRRQLIKKRLDDEDFVYKGIRFYLNSGIYFLSLDKGFSFADGTKVRRLEYSSYQIHSNENYYPLEVFVYDSDRGIDDFSFYINHDLIVAASEKASINDKDPYLKENYFYIKNGVITSNFELSVNGKEYNGFPLKSADVIEYLGLKIIYYEDFLFINSFMAEIGMRPLEISEQLLSYSYQINPLYERINPAFKQLAIEELQEYEAPKDSSDKDMMKVILPNMIMSFTVMATSFISFYTSYNYDRGVLYSLVYLLSPLAMFITGVFLPLLFNHKEKVSYRKEKQKGIDDYLAYLDEYEKMLETRIREYLADHERSYFSLDNLNDDPFYLHTKDEDFLTLSLGRIEIEIPFDHHCDIEVIEKHLSKISRRLSRISNYPFHLELKKYSRLSIVSKAAERQYFLKRFLLELSYKHHSDDLYIAIFSNQIDEMLLSIPHLFYDRKRLTLNTHEQLQELDRLHLDKPLILFMLEKSDFQFTNPDIHVIFFSDDERNVYKNSECIIQYFSSKGKLIAKETEEFTYTRELFDFERYFHRESMYLSINDEEDCFSFMKLFDGEKVRSFYLGKPHQLKGEFAYNGHEILSFDLHEKMHGPHGLIGGSTGSGKSELIISMLLSLCLRYSPEYLNIVLIDYKGGGICESLSYNGVRLPHIVAAISNLENDVLERMIIALKKECDLRQKRFRDLSRISGISIMDLDDYLNNDPLAYGLNKIAHLLIVIDEFAELKKENPEIIKELISISRIGRSLGLHLILATQKPAGNIDEEIWSNSRFKICLKVFEEKDSQDILRCKDGAYLKKPGSFILKIDESYIQAQSIYAKNDIADNDPYEVRVLDNTLNTVSMKNLIREKTISEASYFARLIIEISESLGMKKTVFDFLPPDKLLRQDIKENDNFILGIKDDYIRGIREKLKYKIDDNLLIYSSRSKEINGLINTLNENSRKTLLISHRDLKSVCISDRLDCEDEDALIYLADNIGRSINDYTILIDDIAYLISCREGYGDLLIRMIRKCEKTSNNIVALTSTAQLNFRLINSFHSRVMIETSDRNELSFFFAGRCSYKGRSFCYDEEIISFVPVEIEELQEKEAVFPQIIRKVPEVINAEIIDGTYLIGFDLLQREKVYANKGLLVVSFDEEALQIYKDSYGDLIRICHYDDLPKKKAGKDLLWLGPGIYSQRLFTAAMKNDLQDDEGIYIYKGKKILLKRLNNEKGSDQIQEN